MALKAIPMRQPNMDPQSIEDRNDNLFLFQEQMIRQEIERGNDLCEIIYSLMGNNGPSKLTQAQRKRVQRIKTNKEQIS